MKSFLYCFLFLLFSTTLSSQTLISGFVRDSLGDALIGVSIRQANSTNQTISDFYGAFHIVLDDDFENSLIFHYQGFHRYTINSADTIQGVLNVQLNEIDLTLKTDPRWIPQAVHAGPQGGSISVGLEFFNHGFDNFESVLGVENVKVLNRPFAVPNFDFGLVGKRSYFSLMFGFLSGKNNGQDSINIRLRYNVFALNYGYRLIHSKRIIFMPNVALKQYNYRLFNSPNVDDEELALSQYVQDKELDLQISQTVLFAGATLAFKFRGKEQRDNQFFTVGCYGGYILPLDKTPSIKSQRVLLKNDKRLDIQRLNIGVFFSVNFESDNYY